jgi:hypothetical protein
MDIKEAMAKIGELEEENQNIMADMMHMSDQNKELEDKIKNEKKEYEGIKECLFMNINARKIDQSCILDLQEENKKFRDKIDEINKKANKEIRKLYQKASDEKIKKIYDDNEALLKEQDKLIKENEKNAKLNDKFKKIISKMNKKIKNMMSWEDLQEMIDDAGLDESLTDFEDDEFSNFDVFIHNIKLKWDEFEQIEVENKSYFDEKIKEKDEKIKKMQDEDYKISWDEFKKKINDSDLEQYEWCDNFEADGEDCFNEFISLIEFTMKEINHQNEFLQSIKGDDHIKMI